MLSNVGSGGGAAAAGPAAGAGGAGGAAAEEAKEEEKEEGTFNTYSRERLYLRQNCANFQSREGGVRRGHGLRSFRLNNTFRDDYENSSSFCTFTAWFWDSIHRWCGVKAAISGCHGQSSLSHRLI